MQNRNPFPTDPQSSLLDQAFARARERIDAERAELTAGEEPQPDERGIDELLDGAALLRVLREPVDWLLALARQLAGEDPVDVAAIARIRGAFHARLNGQAARVRTSDVLVVLGLLFSAFDPRLVARAVSSAVTEVIGEARGAMSAAGSDPPIAFFVASAEPIGVARAPIGTGKGPPRCCVFHALLADLANLVR